LLTVHGRTRACGFSGHAEYDTIAEVKASVAIPVIANGDIRSPEDAQAVLQRTGADGVMIGRAAQGRPWIFREISHYLATGRKLAPPLISEIREVLLEHIEGLHQFYGPGQGLRVARKHIGWYLQDLPGGEDMRRELNRIETASAQLAAVAAYFAYLARSGERLRYTDAGEPSRHSREKLAA
jgi:tRNA-dihydrouridine synthase B